MTSIHKRLAHFASTFAVAMLLLGVGPSARGAEPAQAPRDLNLDMSQAFRKLDVKAPPAPVGQGERQAVPGEGCRKPMKAAPAPCAQPK